MWHTKVKIEDISEDDVVLDEPLARFRISCSSFSRCRNSRGWPTRDGACEAGRAAQCDLAAFRFACLSAGVLYAKCPFRRTHRMGLAYFTQIRQPVISRPSRTKKWI